ncbi:MAG: 3-deoxy-manno-octulosonate cytidylyltransferase [Chlamydiota bacterium]|nr:3-deoxy-manno-octulosonate cytidylyltransferase [Chlamydiota bacterium]
MSDPKIIGIIPARISSVRFPQKMLADIQGKPLIQVTYENALKCKKLDQLIVATDSQKIYDCVQKFGGSVVMTSPSCQSGTDRVAEVIKASTFESAELIVNIQGDEPDIPSQTIQGVIEALENDQTADVATPCVKIASESDIQSTSNVKCVFDLNNHALYFSRAMIPHGKSRDFNPEVPYYKHLGLYVYRRNFLLKYQQLPLTPLQKAEDLEQLKILEHGYRIRVVEVESDCVGIDTTEDLKNFITTRFQ